MADPTTDITPPNSSTQPTPLDDILNSTKANQPSGSTPSAPASPPVPAPNDPLAPTDPNANSCKPTDPIKALLGNSSSQPLASAPMSKDPTTPADPGSTPITAKQGTDENGTPAAAPAPTAEPDQAPAPTRTAPTPPTAPPDQTVPQAATAPVPPAPPATAPAASAPPTPDNSDSGGFLSSLGHTVAKAADTALDKADQLIEGKAYGAQGGGADQPPRTSSEQNAPVGQNPAPTTSQPAATPPTNATAQDNPVPGSGAAVSSKLPDRKSVV